jgi:hypothetical protein
MVQMINSNDSRSIYDGFKLGLDSSFASNKNGRQLAQTAQSILTATENFLADNKIVNTIKYAVHDPKVVLGMEALSDASWEVTGAASINQLLDSAQIPQEMQYEAAQAVACLLARWKSCKGDNSMFFTQHFAHGGKEVRAEDVSRSNNMVFAPSLFGDVQHVGVIPGEEAFGANIDKVLPDVRTTMAVTLMQFHRGLLDRVVHRRSSGSPYVHYTVPYAEIYDMLKSYDDDHKVRNDGDHRQTFLSLYNDPRAVSNELQPIIPLIANDTEGVMIADGVLKTNVTANLFDLSVLKNQIGKDHYNYTDLVSENVTLQYVVLNVSNGTVTEVIELPVSKLNDARLNMLPNTNDSGNRGTMLRHDFALGKNTKTAEGDTSTIFAACTDTDIIQARLVFSAEINLKYADVQGYGFLTFQAYNRNGTMVTAEVQALAESLSVEVVGYAVDAKYSEENLRKSNLAIQSHIRTFDFEISNGRNILVDYAMDDQTPNYLMSLVTEAISLGQDHRGIDTIVQTLLHVYNVTNEENNDPNLRERLDKIGFQYPASQLVQPCVYVNVIDISQIDNIRSGDLLGDIRSYLEWFLMHHFALVYANSFYKHALQPGEAPVFKVFTSPIILELCFSIPHYHNHLNRTESVDGSTVEYRRVLPDGTILDCVTTTFNYLRDKIVAIPFRDKDPESVLNFASNWDYGTYVANYTPQMQNAAWKRIFANSRTMVIPTNPIGLYFEVKGLNQFIDMFQTVGPKATKLPQPSDVITPIGG